MVSGMVFEQLYDIVHTDFLSSCETPPLPLTLEAPSARLHWFLSYKSLFERWSSFESVQVVP